MKQSLKINLILASLLICFIVGLIGVIQKPEPFLKDGIPLKRIASKVINRKAPGIGLIQIQGPIQMGSHITPMYQDPGSAESIVRNIYRILDKPRVKALLIKINSPGGTVAATQEIYNAIAHIRSKGIYTVATLGDMAASGGYYIASACDAIFANPGTITGSIGVIISSINFKKLFDNYGIKLNIIKGGKYKDILSPGRNVKPEELKLLQKMVDSTYNQFLQDVSKGRKMKLDTIRPLAEGKLYNGEQALKVGLIDKLGGFRDALYFAHKEAKLPGLVPNLIPLIDNPFEKIFEQISGVENGYMTNLLSSLLHFILPANRNHKIYPETIKAINRFQNQNYNGPIIQYRYIP